MVTATVGRLVSLPMTSAERPRTSALRLSAEPIGTPRMPASRKRARNESPAAIAQTNVDNQLTGIPSMRARSARSAAPRTAMPTRARARNHATAAIASGATINAIRSLALRMKLPMVSRQSTGGSMRCDATVSPHMRGTRIASTASNWVIPIVATVNTRRDAVRATGAPARTRPRHRGRPQRLMPIPNPRRYGRPENRMRPTASDAGTNPRSACAKLRTRFAW